ncbi:hypothetical protein W97_00811 [Coniosporium apollinis CBS 100218]|uniref:Amino acid permease/ SLC12A domain-containing protein n=1 Tax=Coniosporium apollinis (strain CBS 100218) TaxID=1168221 RepID=R7YJ19_CONA1|nr:uncharacterized protein W97_00811 [Coniosporium apollinis CBS 100218]EON61596.1 hypothetical protein W97_00811 [Coniosporium apollinis CBS 100218]
MPAATERRYLRPNRRRETSPANSPVGSLAGSDDSDDYGTELRKDLKERHVNMMAFSACVGVGLFLQAGKVIYLTGPGLAVFAYLIMGTVMWSANASLGEMTALFPVKGPIYEFPRRFLDEAVGYATGWMTWFSWVVIIAAELLAITQILYFKFDKAYLDDVGYPYESLEWPVGLKTNPGVWVLVFLVVIGLINLLPVRQYGELEYFFGCLKMFFLIGLIMFNIIINAQKRFHESRFWTYQDPYGFKSRNITLRPPAAPGAQANVKTGDFGVFLGMWSAMTTVIFSMIGFETVAVTAAENKDLEKDETLKLATRKLSLRVILLYTLCAFTVGLNVPYTDPQLGDLVNFSVKGGYTSAFVIAAVRNHMRFWPQFINGFYVFSATTAGINALYIASRTLHALASTPDVWPQYGPVESLRSRLERTWKGVPYISVFISWLFGFIAFLSTKPSPAQNLGRIVVNSVVSMLIVYAVICASYLQFYRCIKAAARADFDMTLENPQAYDRNRSLYPYKSHGQWARAMYGLVASALLALFNGWQTFVRPMDHRDFIASYISLLVFSILFFAYRIKQQGINIFSWKRRALELRNLNPIEVEAENARRRRGTLKLPDRNRTFTTANLVAIVQWTWVWVK